MRPEATNTAPIEDSQEQFRYLVSYEILHRHSVTVGITATDKEAALEKAYELFDAGTIWDDTEQMPLLHDDFEELDGQALTFEAKALEPGADWPKQHVSVQVLKKRESAAQLASGFIGFYREKIIQGAGLAGESDLKPLYHLALRACPDKASEQ